MSISVIEAFQQTHVFLNEFNLGHHQVMLLWGAKGPVQMFVLNPETPMIPLILAE
tara:strand:- start:638 stop:802 length:165 start_codon:yes stop_codon:yes gene_type:complete